MVSEVMLVAVNIKPIFDQYVHTYIHTYIHCAKLILFSLWLPADTAGASWVKPRSSSQDPSTWSPDSATPSEHCHTPAIDDIQEHLSESFTKTVAEWERLREIRVREAGSPPAEGSRIRSRMKDRSKSRERDRSSRERDRSRHKYEKERQKIERKVVGRM